MKQILKQAVKIFCVAMAFFGMFGVGACVATALLCEWNTAIIVGIIAGALDTVLATNIAYQYIRNEIEAKYEDLESEAF